MQEACCQCGVRSKREESLMLNEAMELLIQMLDDGKTLAEVVTAYRML